MHMASPEAIQQCVNSLEFDVEDKQRTQLSEYLHAFQDAATTIEALLPPDFDPEDPDTTEWEAISNWIITIAQKLPESQMRLIDLVKAFESRVGANFKTFGWELRDAFSSQSPR